MINNYFVILLAILVLIILVILYLFNKQLTSLRIKINSLSYEINKKDSPQNMDILSNIIQQNNPNIFNNEDLDEELDNEDLDEELDNEDLDEELDNDESDKESDNEDLGEDSDEDSDKESDNEKVDEELDNEKVDEELDNEKVDEELDNEKVEIKMKNNGNFTISKKKVPNTPAKYLNIGEVLKSENDTNNYIVASDKNGKKRWKKM